jgi:hypothetical protein
METEPRKILLLYKLFFFDREQNYEPNGTGFMIFGALDN